MAALRGPRDPLARQPRTDRVAKLAEYAEGGIPHYGIVDPDGPGLTEFVLVDGAYRVVSEHRGTAALGLGATLDLTALR